MWPMPTPALVIDEAVARRNAMRLAEYAARHDLAVRPHTKTHKSVRMARLQLSAGAVGLTVAKVGEAEIMSAVCDDLLIAYPAVDEPRCRRIAHLARDNTVRVAVDSAFAVDALARAASAAGATVGILVELDVGFGRTGVQSPLAALELARRVARTEGVRFDGIMCFPGHITGPPQSQDLAGIGSQLARAVTMLNEAGLETPIVSGGSTPTAYQSHRIEPLTELRPGTYIYNDMNTLAAGHCRLEDCAARVVCTVVSDAVPGKVVIDAGSKALTRETARDGGGTFGHVVEYPAARIVRLSEEHGEVDVSACPLKPAIGQRLTVIPNHICPCVNLYDQAWLRTEAGNWQTMPIDARGRLS
ncbi:MAG: hypothetical protein B1H04_04570 [Planctomycetales bacterium 4484_123]|nr:MAG: hypothetical protein B1H04_04570 [Planctomycetales bacterium 4484_123]